MSATQHQHPTPPSAVQARPAGAAGTMFPPTNFPPGALLSGLPWPAGLFADGDVDDDEGENVENEDEIERLKQHVAECRYALQAARDALFAAKDALDTAVRRASNVQPGDILEDPSGKRFKVVDLSVMFGEAVPRVVPLRKDGSTSLLAPKNYPYSAKVVGREPMVAGENS